MIQTIFGFPVVLLQTNNVEKLFPQKIYDQVFAYLTDPVNEFTGHPRSRGGKICTTALHHIANRWQDSLNELDFLLNFLKTTALEHAHLYSNKVIKDLKFCSSWANLTFYGCEINNHIDGSHPGTKSLIVLFYPKVPNNGPDLCFIHNSKGNEWPSDYLEKDLVRIKINQGDIVIIDDLMYHSVDIHQVNDSRLCVAFEFELIT